MKILSWFRVYFMLAWFCKTPLIFLLDAQYKEIGVSALADIAERIKSRYVADFNDCDDFAWRFKGEANKLKRNGVGFVVGWGWGRRCLHCWNIAFCPVGIRQIEPQTGRIFIKDKRYIPLVVII